MKITCPTCFAGQKVREELRDLPVPCKKCGHPYVAADVLNQAASEQAASRDLWHENDLYDDVVSDIDIEVVDDVTSFVADSAIDLKRISQAMTYLLFAYRGVVVSFFCLVIIFVSGIFLPDVVSVHFTALALLAVMGLAFVSGIVWVAAQFKLRGSHPPQSPLRILMSKSLKLSVAGIVTRVIAAIADQTSLRAIGGILSASAIDSFLMYFETLSRQLGDFELSDRVRWLAEFYRRMLWILFVSVMAIAFAGVRLGIVQGLVGIGGIIFLIGFTTFVIRLGAMIRDVHRLTRRLSVKAT